ncbi:MAG: aldehyde dehydrogenase family protein [Ilumatobacteraceae bacterium]
MSTSTTTPISEIPAIVERLRAGAASGLVATRDRREAQLHALRRFLVECEDDLVAALRADLGKPAIEAYTTEIGFTIGAIDHTLSKLARWMRPTRVAVPLQLRPGRARLVPQPLGTVLVIAPWNYPVQLVLAPLVAAIAAGNTAVVKPSEVAPATAELLQRRLGEYLDPGVVAVVTGAVPETTALLEQRFDHIFYTGNGTVGRIVMRAAAEHLTPVTLELGGKSPAIVTSPTDVEVAARRIAWGKFVNAGQTCVAPDHVLVDRELEPAFVEALGDAVERFYGGDPATSPDYARIVNERHHDRLTALLDAGGYDEVALGGEHDRERRYLAPTVLRGVSSDAAVMDDEIFGPILPVIAVDDLDAAIAHVNAGPPPLALYAFTDDEQDQQRVIDATTAGGVTLNHTLLHLVVHDLPFGGVGESGMGAYHGKAGFDVFTHHKPVLTKRLKPDVALLYPPYRSWKQRILRRVL